MNCLIVNNVQDSFLIPQRSPVKLSVFYRHFRQHVLLTPLSALYCWFLSRHVTLSLVICDEGADKTPTAPRENTVNWKGVLNFIYNINLTESGVNIQADINNLIAGLLHPGPRGDVSRSHHGHQGHLH